MSATPNKARLSGFGYQWRTSFHCHREKHQGFTSLHSAVSHSVNEVGKHIYKWWLTRWFYRTQADACGSRAIEWFMQLAHRCWSPLPTIRISCDAGSDDLFGNECAIWFAPCLQHQAKLGWMASATSGGLQSVAIERTCKASLCKLSQRQRFSGGCYFVKDWMLGCSGLFVPTCTYYTLVGEGLNEVTC